MCFTMNDSQLMVARTNGIIHSYTLPHLIEERKIVLASKPVQIFVNSSGSRLATIDNTNLLQFTQLDSDGEQDTQLPYEKKDVWQFKWSLDNDLHCTFMEKYRLNIMID